MEDSDLFLIALAGEGRNTKTCLARMYYGVEDYNVVYNAIANTDNTGELPNNIIEY